MPTASPNIPEEGEMAIVLIGVLERWILDEIEALVQPEINITASKMMIRFMTYYLGIELRILSCANLTASITGAAV